MFTFFPVCMCLMLYVWCNILKINTYTAIVLYLIVLIHCHNLKKQLNKFNITTDDCSGTGTIGLK